MLPALSASSLATIQIPTPHGPIAATVDLPSEPAGDARDASRSEGPATSRRGVAVFSHCFAGNRRLRISTRLSKALAAAGLISIRIDYRGHGDSPGVAGKIPVSVMLEDLLSVTDWTSANVGPVEVLAGHSLGGMLSLMAAPHLPQLTGVVAVTAPFRPGRVWDHLTGELQARPHGDGMCAQIANREWIFGHEYLADLENIDPHDFLPQVTSPALLVSASNDHVIPSGDVHQISQLLPVPVLQRTISPANHMFTIPGAADKCAKVVTETVRDW